MAMRQGGFTLVEVLMALGVCTFALMSLLPLLVVSLGSAQQALDFTRRDQIVQRVAADLAQSQYASLAGKSWYFDSEGNPVPSADGGGYSAQAQIETTNSLPLPGADATTQNMALVRIVTTNMRRQSATNFVTVANCGY